MTPASYPGQREDEEMFGAPEPEPLCSRCSWPADLHGLCCVHAFEAHKDLRLLKSPPDPTRCFGCRWRRVCPIAGRECPECGKPVTGRHVEHVRAGSKQRWHVECWTAWTSRQGAGKVGGIVRVKGPV